jgi:hypothetical protein
LAIQKYIKIKIYRIIILPVLYGFETWSLTLRKAEADREYGVEENI